jgi:hypothetical protein
LFIALAVADIAFDAAGEGATVVVDVVPAVVSVVVVLFSQATRSVAAATTDRAAAQVLVAFMVSPERANSMVRREPGLSASSAP